MSVAHDFKASLEFSHACEDLPFWREVYEKAFPGFQGMHSHRMDGDHQRAGIDRSVILDNSKRYLVDEKVRGKNAKTGRIYEDIALEFWSDRERRQRGWVCKPLLCDYIAYAIAPLGRCYLFPVPALQNAWIVYGDEWQKTYQSREAFNRSGNGHSWTTEFCPVPISALFPAIGEMLRVSFAACEYVEK